MLTSVAVALEPELAESRAGSSPIFFAWNRAELRLICKKPSRAGLRLLAWLHRLHRLTSQLGSRASQEPVITSFARVSFPHRSKHPQSPNIDALAAPPGPGLLRPTPLG